MLDIKVPYNTRPSMNKHLGPVYSKITDQYLDYKKKELEKYGNDLYGITQELEIAQILPKVSSFLTLNANSNIIDIALTINEDIAILHNGKLVGICFCFPSSWVPAERLGLSLAEIHSPVADNYHLVTYSDKLAQTMCDTSLGCFSRQVWTITTNKNLSNHPKISKPELKNFNDLYFRIEKQTTYPLVDKSTSLFFVKVEVIKLDSIWQQYGTMIKASINSMTDNILQYKNLYEIKELINRI